MLATTPSGHLLERLDLARVEVDGHALPLKDRRGGPNGVRELLDELRELRADLLEAAREQPDGAALRDVGLDPEPVVLVLEGRPPVHPLQDGREVPFAFREHWADRAADLERDGRETLHALLDEDAGDEAEVAREAERRLDALAGLLGTVPERIGEGVQDRHLPNADPQRTDYESDDELTLERRGAHQKFGENLDLALLRTRSLRPGDPSELAVHLGDRERLSIFEPPDRREKLADRRPEVPGLLGPTGHHSLLGVRRGGDRPTRERVGHSEFDPLVLRAKETLGQVQHPTQLGRAQGADQLDEDRAHLEAL